MSRSFLGVLLAILVLLPACSDDATGPEPFKVTVKVVDLAGDPVPGLRLNVTSNNDFLQETLNKAAVRIPFTIVVRATARLTIEDVSGHEIRTLVDGELVAGRHLVQWDGRDDAGDHCHGGYYEARLEVRELGTGTGLWEGTAPMLMALLDADDNPVGVTDEGGRVVLTDRRLFPHLYDVPPFPSTDENGETQGMIDLDAEMIFALGDTATGTHMYVVTEVPGSGRFEFLWAPRSAPVLPTAPPPAPVRGIAPEDPVFEIGPIFPNPFN